MNDEDKAESLREVAAMTTASVPLVAARLRSALATLVFWRERARQRRRLACLDDRLLADIGITRAQARRESCKRFWQD